MQYAALPLFWFVGLFLYYHPKVLAMLVVLYVAMVIGRCID